MEYELLIYGTEETILLDCQGSGYEEDPIIIDSEILPNDAFFNESSEHIIIQNCFIDRALYIRESQNITIKKCGIGSITISSSSNCLIEKTKITKFILLVSSQNITLKDCKITKLESHRSKNNLIISCVITKKISKRARKGNKFEKMDLI